MTKDHAKKGSKKQPMFANICPTSFMLICPSGVSLTPRTYIRLPPVMRQHLCSCRVPVRRAGRISLMVICEGDVSCPRICSGGGRRSQQPWHFHICVTPPWRTANPLAIVQTDIRDLIWLPCQGFHEMIDWWKRRWQRYDIRGVTTNREPILLDVNETLYYINCEIHYHACRTCGWAMTQDLA